LLNYFLHSLLFFKLQSYLNIFNAFRANFEDFNWLNTVSKDLTKKNINALNINISLTNFLNKHHEDIGLSKLSNPLTLRLTTKNSIVNFNALQKVFRARFEDGRSNTGLAQFSELYSTQPFLNTNRINYEDLLGKTRNNFFNNNFFNNNIINIFNLFYSSTSSLNFNFFNFPFLLSAKSDMSRYM